MNKTLSILFLTATMAQAQTTLLCEDNFTSSSVVGCNISPVPSPNFQRTNGVLQYDSYNNINNSAPYQPVNISFTNSLSEYDTLKLEMDFTISGPYSFYSNQFIIQNYINPIQFNYTDATNNKSYTGSMNENTKPPFIIMLPNTSNTYSSNKLITKMVKPTGLSYNFMTFQSPPPFHDFSTASWGQLNPMISGNYSFDINQDPTFVTKIKQAFCATTGNPTDCQTKVNVMSPPPIPIRFNMDNFKAYGIKAVVAGLEEEIKPLNTRTLIGIYNSLGQKLDSEQTHEGLVIKMYSDGTKEKVFINNK